MNRAKTRIKVLCFDGTGCWVSVKRLEQGTFSWPKGLDGGKMSLKPEALALLLDGVDLRGPHLRPWYVGRSPVHNLVENAIRPTAIGKKNWLFFGSPTSGQESAVIYSLIETCRKLGINPSDYLREVPEALPEMKQDEAADWTPARWKSSRETRSA